MSLDEWSIERAAVFFLVFARMGGVCLSAPFVGDRVIPAKVRIALSLLLAFMTFGNVRLPEGFDASLGCLALGAAVELLVGLGLGMIVQILLSGVEMAGELVGHDVGFSIVNVVDPDTDEQASVLGQFQYFVALIVFLALGGEAVILKGLVRSYEIVPLAGGRATMQFVDVLIGVSARMFDLAVGVAAPAVVILFLVTVALGFLARTVPQMNVLIVGFPLRTGVGLAMVMMTIPVICIAMDGVVRSASEQVGAALRALSAGG